MNKKPVLILNLITVLSMAISLVAFGPTLTPALAMPDDGSVTPSRISNTTGELDLLSTAASRAKAIDQPNPIEYQRNKERARLLDAGQTAEAAALAKTGTARPLVLLVDFAGTDVFTWKPGDTWDPLGRADENEYTGIIGDCSNIITTTQTFTYTGPAHNQIPRPLSPEDRSGDSIWTEDFSKAWYESFMFGQGVVFSYTMQDGTPVHEDFTGQSVKDYYLDMSNGVFTVTGDVVGWLPVDHSTWYYEADQCPGARSIPASESVRRGGQIPGAGSPDDLVRDALDKVNEMVTAGDLPNFNWTDYDGNGDGTIDSLWLVHAGYGEEDGTVLLNRTNYGEAAVWSHSGGITPYEVDPVNHISASSYIMMPENGGMSVFAHEFGHNIGADDLYTYGDGQTSAGFWTEMSDSWVDHPIGFGITSFDPWHLDYGWGWLDDHMKVITDTSQVYEFYVGQASKTPSDTYRAAKIELPNGVLPLGVPVWEGDYYWWGGAENLANGMMTKAQTISIPTPVTTATLSFETAYGIESEWDFLWVQASDDLGTTWDTLTNTHTQCIHDPSWIGGLYGFPDDLCAANIGGFYGYNASFPDPDTEEFDLSMYAGEDILLRFWYMTDWGTLYEGPFVDNINVTIDGTVVFSDTAELDDGKWTTQLPWQRSNGNQEFSQNFYLQWRNTNENGGYDRSLGDPRWRFGPANTGLVTWYNNNFYKDNEIFNYLFDYPGFGPKGRMLVVDSHPEPYRDPYYVDLGYDNEGGNVRSRGLMRDAPFTLADTVDFTLEPPEEVYTTTMFEGRPAVKAFHDSLGYYPGAEYASRGPGYPPEIAYKWVTKQWDASVVVPSKEFYGIRAPGYIGTGGTGDQEFRFDCSKVLASGRLACYFLGTNTGLGYDGTLGDPAEVDGQYGWHAEVLEEAADHTWAKVRVWNSMYAADSKLTTDADSLMVGDTITYSLNLENVASQSSFLACVQLDGTPFEYVPGSGSDGVLLLDSCPASETPSDLQEAQAGAVGAIAWLTPDMATEDQMDFDFQLMVQGVGPSLTPDVHVYTPSGEIYTTLTAESVAAPGVLLPFVSFGP